MHIPFSGIKIQSKKSKREVIKIVSAILDEGNFLKGSQNEQLTEKLKSYFKKEYFLTTASGHDSLLLALQSLQLNTADEIIFPVNAYPTAFAICQSKGKPVPVDVDIYGQIDIDSLIKKINKRTKAIVAVHLYGLVTNILKIKEIIKNKKIFIIEDCAQAFGSLLKNKPAGTYGDIACFSFYPTKNLATLGDGGAILTKNKKIYQYLLQAASYGEKERYYSQFISGHSRLPEIQAGVLNLYLESINKNLQKRTNIFYLYKRELERKKLLNNIRILYTNNESKPALHLLVVETKKRDQLKQFLSKKNIETLIHYPHPIHLVPAFSSLGYRTGSFPQAEWLAKNILSLPFHTHLTNKQINFVVKSIRNFYYG